MATKDPRRLTRDLHVSAAAGITYQPPQAPPPPVFSPQPQIGNSIVPPLVQCLGVEDQPVPSRSEPDPSTHHLSAPSRSMTR